MFSDSTLNTIIGSVTTILVAIIGVAQVRQSRRTKEIAEQTVNDHKDKPNLREDIDTIKQNLKFLSRDIGGMREEQRQLRREVYDQGSYGRENRHLIHELEKTLPPKKRKNDNE